MFCLLLSSFGGTQPFVLTLFISNGNLPTLREQSCSVNYMKITTDYNAYNEETILDALTEEPGV